MPKETPSHDGSHGTNALVYLPIHEMVDFFWENVGKFRPYMDPMRITIQGLPCPRDPGSPSENGSMEPKYYAFRR